MSDVTITLNAAEAMYVLEAIAVKASADYQRATRLIEAGADTASFEMSVVQTAILYTDSAHRKLQSALYGPDDDAAIAHQMHDGDPECARCVAIGEQQAVDWYTA